MSDVEKMERHESPRQAAERIVQSHLDNSKLTDEDLRNAITTAIQAASNAQLERGREHEDALNKARKREAENYRRILADHEKQIEEWKKQNNGLKSTLRAKIAELESEIEHQRGYIDGLKHTAQVSVEDAYANRHIRHVREFMERFEQHVGDTPGFPPQEVLDLRIRLMAEEFAEMLDAAGYPFVVQIGKRGRSGFYGWDYGDDVIFKDSTENSGKPDLPAFIDALLDLEYVILGTHVSCGVDPQPIWEAVHASNMAKQPADDKFSKIVKPAGWVAPDIAGALRDQGWER